MTKITKRYKTIRANITRGKLYPVDQAMVVQVRFQ